MRFYFSVHEYLPCQGKKNSIKDEKSNGKNLVWWKMGDLFVKGSVIEQVVAKNVYGKREF